ncbi:outer dense fiber protein 2-like isoform X2 [Cheilinus undulatus]|uniref:outer dense fiber protein 2-like isoform X2 n=1 Tax=Cheilinus undulatus TaxID=241271 RepID=UPI001BD451A0|nr:outer dense fiber protein 2-like isoform X2 [Cheilinus undulatus]
MKTQEAPPPVHVHVPETTPVHVHMRRSPSRTTPGRNKHRTKDTPVKKDQGKPKTRAPWIPPGRLPCRRDESRVQHQPERGNGHQFDADEDEEEEELAAVSKNLRTLLQEQESIRRLDNSDVRGPTRESAVLLRTLVEAEIDGVAVANQLAALKETIDSLVRDKRLTKLNTASLRQQRQLLLEKIAIFDSTNHSLRGLLLKWTEFERESLIWLEQKDAIKKRLADSEAENIRLLSKLTNKEKEACTLAEHLDFEKDKVETTEELSRVLQSTRDHLQSELNSAEAEKSRLAAQIQRMQQTHEEQQEELQTLQEELKTVRQRIEEEKKEQEQREREALALLTRQAEGAEETAKQLTTKLQEKETQLAQALSTSSDWCLQHSKEAAARRLLEEEASALRLQITELDSKNHSTEEKSRIEREELRDQIQHLSAENTSNQLENQKLKDQLRWSEEKLGGLQSEARQLKSGISKHENLLEKYKKKVQQARLESDDCRLKLEVTKQEARELKASLEREKEQLRRELLARLRELETLPDKLRRTEQQLRDAQQEAEAKERRNMEHSTTLSEIRHKVEQQGDSLVTFQQKNVLLQEENNVLKEKLHNLERRLEDLRVENKEMTLSLTLKEDGTRSLQQQLEERTLECGVVSRQLQQTLDDVQRQVDKSMQRVLAKEKASQAKALDLQSQLNLAKTEQSQLQKSKEEMERRFNIQLQNLKEQLELSNSTNRTLKNYVQLLKTSYGNVFGDPLFSS